MLNDDKILLICEHQDSGDGLLLEGGGDPRDCDCSKMFFVTPKSGGGKHEMCVEHARPFMRDGGFTVREIPGVRLDDEGQPFQYMYGTPHRYVN